MQVTEHDSARPSVAGRKGRGRFVLRHRITGLLLVGGAVTCFGVAAANAQSVEVGDAGAVPKVYVMSDIACTDGRGSLSLMLVNDGDAALARFGLAAAPSLGTRTVVVAPGSRESVMITDLEDGPMGFPIEVEGGVEHVQATVACAAGADKSALGVRVHHSVATQPEEPVHRGTGSTALLGGGLVLAGAATAWVVRRRYALAERTF
ncbi:MAG: hypothetical protein RI900_1210 [Actinomycetota bacterium]|jgi:hypothetical protein